MPGGELWHGVVRCMFWKSRSSLSHCHLQKLRNQTLKNRMHKQYLEIQYCRARKFPQQLLSLCLQAPPANLKPLATLKKTSYCKEQILNPAERFLQLSIPIHELLDLLKKTLNLRDDAWLSLICILICISESITIFSNVRELKSRKIAWPNQNPSRGSNRDGASDWIKIQIDCQSQKPLPPLCIRDAWIVQHSPSWEYILHIAAWYNTLILLVWSKSSSAPWSSSEQTGVKSSSWSLDPTWWSGEDGSWWQTAVKHKMSRRRRRGGRRRRHTSRCRKIDPSPLQFSQTRRRHNIPHCHPQQTKQWHQSRNHPQKQNPLWEWA